MEITTEGRIGVGSLVRFEAGDAQEWLRLVPADEADARHRLVNVESPVGMALLGHCVGDVVRVRTPGGIARLTIISVGE